MAVLVVNFINRAAVVVRPKAPFFEWARSVEGGLPESTDPWTSVYLVAAGENEEPSQVMRRCFASIFEEQLDDWPWLRTMVMFREWLKVTLIDLVFDLADGAIEIDE